MPKIIQFIEGDGVNDDAYNITIQIPDGNAGAARIEGTATAVGLPAVSIAVSSDPLPAAPVLGLLYFNLQLDPVIGSVAAQQSAVAQPAALLASNGVTLCRIIYNDVLSPTSTDPAYDGGTVPTDPAGLP